MKSKGLIVPSTGWDYLLATKVVDEALGWDEDRTELLRTMAAAFREVWEEARSDGIAVGAQRSWSQLFCLLTERAEKTDTVAIALRKAMTEMYYVFLKEKDPICLRRK